MKFCKVLVSAFVFLCLLSSCEKKDSGGGNTDPIIDSDDYAYLQGKSAKRGVGFNWQSEFDIQLLQSAVCWSYNWSSNCENEVSVLLKNYGITYFPMAWNANYNKASITKWVATHPESDFILAFNEPNLKDQANMTPKQAAGYWPDLLNFAKSLNLKLTTPAMNHGTVAGYNDPIKWLDEFFSQPGVSVNDVDAVAIHIYMNNVTAMMNDLTTYKKYGKKIWLTEFCSWDAATSATQIQFMSTAFNALEQDPDVERYAWFIPRGGYVTEGKPFMQLLTKTYPSSYTERGRAFMYLSTFDKSVVYPLGKRIPAEHYRACSIAEDFTSVPVALTTDVDGMLQLDGLSPATSVDYQVAFNGESNAKFQLRYASGRDSKLDVFTVSADGSESLWFSMDAPKTGGANYWTTIEQAVSLPNGTKVIRLRPSSGLLRVNWIKFTK